MTKGSAIRIAFAALLVMIAISFVAAVAFSGAWA